MRIRRYLASLVSVAALIGCTAVDNSGFGALNAESPDAASSADDGSTPDDRIGPAVSDDGAAMDATSTPTPDIDSGGAKTSGADAQSSDAGAQGDTSTGVDLETGRLVGMTAAHNAVRAAVMTQPPLPPLTWSPTLAAYAQAWATQLASDPTTCAQPQHRPASELQAKGYGENLATRSMSGGTGYASTAQWAVDDWAAEKACWTYGTIGGTGVCDMACTANLNSDGCLHYTQIVWRKTLELGCGVGTCQSGGFTQDIWICNYSPGGNIGGYAPY